MSSILDTSRFEELAYPKELRGSWFYYVFFDSHPTLSGIVCVYFNDKYPSGTVLIGEYLLNDYPDVYLTWKKDDTFGNVMADRVLVSPSLRMNGIGRSSIVYIEKSLKHLFKKTLKYDYGSDIGNRLWSSAFRINNVEDTKVEKKIDLIEDSFDQPAYPHIFFGRRVSK